MSKKLTIEHCHKIAKSRNGKCLSTEYINHKTKYLWKCRCGEEFYISFANVKMGQWCPKCFGYNTNSIEDCYKLAGSKNGKFLSEIYINSKIKYLWECEKGHQWKMSYSNVYNGHWCPKCGAEKRGIEKRHNINFCKELAKKYNGKCLSEKYITSQIKYSWECKKGHQFYMCYNDVQQGHWCPECAFFLRTRSNKLSYVFYHWKTNEKLIATASYEKAVVEWLNKNKIDYEWQKRKFMTNIITKTGKKSYYLPDLYIINENKWIEIKGYMREYSKQKWNWFHKTYPNSELWDKNKLEELGIL